MSGAGRRYTGLTAIASSATSRPATVKTATSSLSRIILDGKSRTLYPFEKDQHGKSACSGACAANWPPLLTKGAPKAAASARASLLGTIRRPDGTTQVTYNKHPLYTFVGDAGRRGATSGGGAPARPTGEPAGPARGPEWIPGRATRDPMRYLP